MTGTLRCFHCESTYPLTERITRCPGCQGLLEIERPLAPRSAGGAAVEGPPGPGVSRGSGVWRYRPLIYPEIPEEAIVSWPEGNTPLVSRSAVSQWAAIPGLTLKHEGMNPTGSFKDRGMTVAISHAKRLGIATVGCASTGNTSASLAAYAAQAGMRAVVLVPSGKTAAGKLAQAIGYGATIVSVRGDFDRSLQLVDQAAEALSIYLVNSINPFRLQGQKTIVLELLEQRGWRPPDWIVLPAGNLGNTSAFGAALVEARALGLIDRIPRLAAIQATGAAPFARSFEDGFRRRVRVEAETVASAIRIGNPASWQRAVRAIQSTDGIVTTVEDDEILSAKQVIDECGVGCEPASAAAVAGARKLARAGVIRPTEEVVAVLTGSLLKDPDSLLAKAKAAIIEIDPTIAALEAALSAAS